MKFASITLYTATVRVLLLSLALDEIFAQETSSTNLNIRHHRLDNPQNTVDYIKEKMGFGNDRKEAVREDNGIDTHEDEAYWARFVTEMETSMSMGDTPALPDTSSPTPTPTASPSSSPTVAPSPPPTPSPTSFPTAVPTSSSPTPSPTNSPSASPTNSPTLSPTPSPTLPPTQSPTPSPTTLSPTSFPTAVPTSSSPTPSPTNSPSASPTNSPTLSPTPSPTLPPTRSPTPPPTLSPTSSPTAVPTSSSPTPSPTNSPSASPTNSPTLSPTHSPTLPNTPSPTMLPTPSPTTPPTTPPTQSPTLSPTTQPPTLSPTNSPTTPLPGCSVDVAIECMTNGGIPCTDISATDGQCSKGTNSLETLTFQYQFASCSDSSNSQQDDEAYLCKDLSNLNKCEFASKVNIRCVGTDDNIEYFKGEVGTDTSSSDSFFVIQNPSGGSTATLPDALKCTASVTELDAIYRCQEIEFDTSGSVDLVLTDSFGSMTLSGCTDDESNTEDCFKNVTYTYKFDNVGEIYMDITKVLRKVNDGNYENLVGLVPPGSNPLQVGENTTIQESVTVYTCSDNCYSVEVFAEADPPSDTFCNDTETYDFCIEYNKPCDAEVSLSCVTADGKNCSDIEPPTSTQCALAPDTITKLAFEYTLEGCDSGANDQNIFQCNDDSACVRGESDEVVITCEDVDSGFELSNSSLSVGDMFALSSSSNEALFSRVQCNLSTLAGCVSQSFVFDPSGDEDLKLNDYFGSLKVKSCNDGDNTIATCLEEVMFTYFVSNDGTTPLNITNWNRGSNDGPVDLLSSLTDEEKYLLQDETVAKNETETIDTCTPQCISNTASVTAVSEDGSICRESVDSEFCIQTSPPTPAPTPYPLCTVDVEVDCVTADGVPCEDIPPTNGQCKPDLSPLTTLEFQYQFRLCNESMNSQSTDDFYSCEDLDDIEQCRNGEGLTIQCEGSNNVVYFDGNIGSDGIIPIIAEENSILSSLMTCKINKITETDSFECQEVTFDTSGTEDLVLTDSFGSLSLSSCADNAGNMANCFQDIIYTYTLTNVGDIEMNITEAIRTYNYDNAEDLIGLFPQEKNPLQVGDSVDITDNRTISLCGDNSYQVEIFVEADPPGDVNCNDTGFFELNVTFEKPCDIQVDLICELTGDDFSGSGCDDVFVPDFACSNTEIAGLTFSYENSTCPESDNEQDIFECEDFECSEDGSVRVLCESGGTVFCNCTVEEGGLILISSLLVLPDSLTCTVYPENSDEKCQEFSLNPSGTDKLNLKDSFGSLTIETCDDTVGVKNTCLFDSKFTYTITNSGSSNFGLSSLKSSNNGDVKELLPSGSPPNIPAGVSAQVTEPSRIDACAGYLEQTIYAEGIGLGDGKMCFDEDSLDIDFGSQAPSTTKFPTKAPTVSPTESAYPTRNPGDVPCNITALIECSVDGGAPCASDLRLPTVQCRDEMLPSELEFIFTGAECSGETSEALKACVDENGGPKGIQSVDITVEEELGVILFNESVALGTFFSVPVDGKGKLTIKISDGDILLQTVNIDTNCENDNKKMFTSEMFGALQLTGFDNGVQSPSGSVTITLSYSVVNENRHKLIVDKAEATGQQTSSLLPNGEFVELSRLGQKEVLGDLVETINLFQIAGSSEVISYELEVEGSALANSFICSSTSSYELKILQ